MSTVECKFSNFTKFNLSLDIIDKTNLNTNDISINSKDNKSLRLKNNTDHEIKIKNINGNLTSISFYIEISSYIAILETFDMIKNEIYLQDFISNKKYFTKSENFESVRKILNKNFSLNIEMVKNIEITTNSNTNVFTYDRSLSSEGKLNTQKRPTAFFGNSAVNIKIKSEHKIKKLEEKFGRIRNSFSKVYEIM